MCSQLVNYHLYREPSKPVAHNFTHVELFDFFIDRFSGKIRPHIHTNLVHILCIKAGKTLCYHGNKELEIEGPCIIIIPANTLHSFLYKTTVGWAFTLSDRYVEELLKREASFLSSFDKLLVIKSPGQDSGFADLFKLADKIREEHVNSLPGKNLVLQSYFSILLIESLRYYHAQEQVVLNSDTRGLKYYNEFLKLIKNSFFGYDSINAYANQLKITHIHLNRICRQVSGKPALQVIQERIIQDAIKYLKDTNYTVSEISYKLNIENPCYFSRLFKKHTGVSPRAYRNAEAGSL